MAYEPLHHKYRPQTFADLVGQEAIATTLSNAMKTQRIAPAYLLTGARGTGKTSTARIMAKSLNCLSFDAPTATPCGKCEMCVSITRGNALDITEIDAASNTGVDNIRDLIERSQFAPVQARYKVYAIDECLTGDALVQTDRGLMRIDDPKIKGRQVLSYNENLKKWEFKKVLRWLDRGIKPTLIIKTTHKEIRCTENHLISTDRGWIQAKNVKEGMKILSPVNAAVGYSSINMAQITVSADLPVDTNFAVINLEQSHTTSQLSSNKQSHLDHSVPVTAEKNWTSPNSYSRKAKELSVFNQVGKHIHIKKVTDCGINAHQTMLISWELYSQKNWDLSMAPYWEMDRFPIPTNIVDFQGLYWHKEKFKGSGWNTKQEGSQQYNPKSILLTTTDMEVGIKLSTATSHATLNSRKYSALLNQKKLKRLYLEDGLIELLPKEWLGGLWMMVPLATHLFNFIQRDFHCQKTKLSLSGSQKSTTLQKFFKKLTVPQVTPISDWEPKLQENGHLTLSNMQSHQWHTNLEIVESVEVGNIESVYDIEVEDNHNFVANGLLLHNCHSLSTSAFNALLKTLEEPPDRVVFILATTDPQRVLPTIISRCQRFDFRRIPLEPMVQHLTKIAQIENININSAALLLVGQMAQGGLRDAESLLDQLSLHEGEINNEIVWDLVGSVPERDLLDVLRAIATQNSVAVIEKIRQILDRGREPLTVLQSLAGFYRDLLIAKTAGDRSDLVALTAETWTNLKQIAQDFALESILMGQQHLRSAEVQIKNTTQPRLWLEVALIGLFNQAPTSSVSPQTTNNQALTSNVSPLTSNNEALTLSVSPLNSNNQALTSSVSPLTSNNQASTSNVSPQTSSSEPSTFSYQDFQDLNLAWQQLTKYLSPPARAIFVNKATFLEINEDNVVIGLKDKGLREIAIKKREELEKSCKQIFNRNVKVQFRFVSSNEVPKSSIVSESSVSSGGTHLEENRPIPQSSATADNAANKTVSKISDRSPNNSSIPAPIEVLNTSTTEANLNLDREKIDEQITSGFVEPTAESEAIKNVVTFFDGQIIDLI
jgi:DNA polymerase III subunit gamma/tau